MKNETKKVRQEVIDAQKDAVVKEVATLEIQLDFMEKEHEFKVEEATKIKDKEQKEASLESLANHKLQKITPMKDNIDYKTKYFDYLSSLE